MQTTTRRGADPRVVVVTLACVYAVPLLLAGRPYVDDLKRSLDGSTGWIINARPLSDVLMIALNTGYPMADLAPLTQLAAVALYTIVCLQLLKWTSGMAMPTIWRALACTAPLLSPFLLQNNAYRFDSLPMAVAFLACAWAVRPYAAGPVLGVVRCAALVFVGLCIYQAAANVTVALAIVLLAVEIRRADPPRAIWSRLAVRLAGFALASIVYAFTIGAVLIGGTYTLAHSRRVPFSLEGAQTIAGNFGRATVLIWNSFDVYQLWLLAGTCALAFATLAVVLARRIRAGQVTWSLALVCVLGVAGLLLTPLGLSGALQAPVLEPRVLMTFGIVLSFFLLFAAEGLTALARAASPRPLRVLGGAGLFFFVVMPIVVCLTIAYAFGSAQARQDDADRALVSELRNGLAALSVHKSFYLAVDGQQPFTAAATTSIDRFPVLGKLVPRYFTRDWYWSVGLLRYHDVPARFDVRKSNAAIKKARQMEPGYRGTGFTLTLVNDTLVLRFPG